MLPCRRMTKSTACSCRKVNHACPINSRSATRQHTPAVEVGHHLGPQVGTFGGIGVARLLYGRIGQRNREANLIASEQAEMALQTGHVVMDRYWTSTVAFAALDDTSNINQEWQGCYPPELRVPDVVIPLTVDEENRTKRMRGRGEPATIEEQNLAADIAPRKAVLQTYRMFKPVEIDTSHLDPDAVLEKVLAALHKHKKLNMRL